MYQLWRLLLSRRIKQKYASCIDVIFATKLTHHSILYLSGEVSQKLQDPVASIITIITSNNDVQIEEMVERD